MEDDSRPDDRSSDEDRLRGLGEVLSLALFPGLCLLFFCSLLRRPFFRLQALNVPWRNMAYSRDRKKRRSGIRLTSASLRSLQ